MSLVGKVDGRVWRTLAGYREAEEIRHGAAADEQATGGFRKTADLAQPADGLQLHGGGARTADPSAGEYVVSRNNRVGERTHVVARPGDVSEEARMIYVHGVVEHALLQISKQIVEAGALFGRRSADACQQLLGIALSADRLFAQGAVAINRDQAQACYSRLQQILTHDVAMLWLYERKPMFFYNKRLKNVVTGPNGPGDGFGAAALA